MVSASLLKMLPCNLLLDKWRKTERGAGQRQHNVHVFGLWQEMAVLFLLDVVYI